MGIIELRNISFSYGVDNFIDDLSMSVDSGKFVGIIGANGSGKSTLLKLTAGILRPAAGRILLWGKSIYDYRGKDRAKLLSYLPQLLDISIPFTVKELISMGLYPYDIMPELSPEEAVSMVGLEDKLFSPISELSGGERRRVYIAMTLLQGAGILLLDEPLANLDVKYQIEFIRLLRELRREKDISIIMALHDINMAFRFDELYVIKEGRIIASGVPSDVITAELLKEAFDIDLKIFDQGNGMVSFGY
ncbi:MAG TPA: ABC transporter ATP-binding protein [Nitrospirae bacterium]|nr:iron(3+)-hydroxamate import ATP-binding protein FhuC [bacterium BMS3Bbin05]HDO36077.1 ABC transporter ATP-binding protein [Nitrospirota bacterium]HDZ87273.1 ABC transporter ATP-binding protein [Nitrospirota bacterium]